MKAPICPTCGEVARSVTEHREPEVGLLCEQPSAEPRMPGARWLVYEPCGHQVSA